MMTSDNPMAYRGNYRDIDIHKSAEVLSRLLSNKLDDAVFICVGTDKCIGDVLGPLVGTFLKEYGFKVVGTLDEPAHAVNLDSKYEQLKKLYPGHKVVAIDACLGYSEFIGDLQIKDGPIHPGKGVGKSLNAVGDVSLVGVVDSMDVADMFSIRSIRLNLIMSMAKTIVSIILAASGKPEKTSL